MELSADASGLTVDTVLLVVVQLVAQHLGRAALLGELARRRHLGQDLLRDERACPTERQAADGTRRQFRVTLLRRRTSQSCS